MPRKSKLIASVSTVLTIALVLAVAAPDGRGGVAHADESAQRANGEADPPRDRSLALPGQLVRIADASAASCAATAPVDLKALGDAIRVQIVHRARLEAELQGRGDIELPAPLQGQQSLEPVAGALRDEQTVFAARKDALGAQVASLTQDKGFSQREIELTTAKEAALARQEALAQKDLDKIGGLLSEGLVAGPQKLALEQNILQAEANRLDVKLATLRAQEEISKIDRNIADLRNQWRNDSLAEFNKTQAALADLAQQARAAESPNAAPARAAAQGECGEARETLYVIVRGPGGALQAFPVAAMDAKSPGDRPAGAALTRNGQ